jgi:hypothetical protein
MIRAPVKMDGNHLLMPYTESLSRCPGRDSAGRYVPLTWKAGRTLQEHMDLNYHREPLKITTSSFDKLRTNGYQSNFRKKTVRGEPVEP